MKKLAIFKLKSSELCFPFFAARDTAGVLISAESMSGLVHKIKIFCGDDLGELEFPEAKSATVQRNRIVSRKIPFTTEDIEMFCDLW